MIKISGLLIFFFKDLKKISKINRDKIISYANQEYEISSVAKKYIQVYSEIDFTSSINFRTWK